MSNLNRIIEEALEDSSTRIADYIDENYSIKEEMSDLIAYVSPIDIIDGLTEALKEDRSYNCTITVQDKSGSHKFIVDNPKKAFNDNYVKELKKAFWSGKKIIHKAIDGHETVFHMDMTEEPLWSGAEFMRIVV